MYLYKKPFFFILYLLVAVPVFYFSGYRPYHPKEHPGWMEQYREMKNITPGINYYGLRNQWEESDKLNKKTNQVIGFITEVGPDNVAGRVRALLIDAADSNHIFAGGVSGGLWHSYNGGLSWEPINEHSPSLAVTCITQNPFNPQEIYYGTGESTGNSANIDGAGIFKSTDGGKTFSQLTSSLAISAFSNIWDVEHSKTDSATLYVSVKTGGVYRSLDKGNSFKQIFTSSSEVHELLTYKDSTVWAGIYGYGIISGKEDSVMKFSLLKGGLPASGFGRISMNYSRDFPKVAFCQIMNAGSTALSGIYKTSDHGVTWKKTNSTTKTGVYSWAWYCLNTNVGSKDTNFVLSLSVDAVYSTNGGLSWNTLRSSHADFHISAFYPSGNQFLLGNDGGVYRFNKSTAGSSNVSLNNGLNITQYYTGALNRHKSHVFMGGTQDNHTHYFDGTSFSDILGGDGSYCAFSSTPPFYIYASYQNGEIRRMNSSFGSQFNIKPPGSYSTWFINPFVINPLEGNQVFYLTKSKVLVSKNAGDNWEDLTKALNKNILSMGISYETDPTIYCGGGGSALYRIKNAATRVKEEKDLTNTSPANAKGGVINDIKVSHGNPSTVYLAMSDISTKPRLWKLNHALGDTCKWINISGDLPVSLPVNCIEVHPQDSNKMLAGTDFGLYASANGGTNWVKIKEVPNVVVFKIHAHLRDGKVYIFTHGRGVFRAQFNQFVAGVKPEEKSKLPYTVLFNNPVHNQLVLNIKDLPSSGNNRIYLFDLRGNLMLSESLYASKQVDLEGLKPGIYLMRLEIADKGFTYRLLKQ